MPKQLDLPFENGQRFCGARRIWPILFAISAYYGFNNGWTTADIAYAQSQNVTYERATRLAASAFEVNGPSCCIPICYMMTLYSLHNSNWLDLMYAFNVRLRLYHQCSVIFIRRAGMWRQRRDSIVTSIRSGKHCLNDLIMLQSGDDCAPNSDCFQDPNTCL
jgi:hypothetical protein